MSIAALNQVYDEVRRLTIAGSDLAANDFRLQKLVPPLRRSAEKAPVFGRVADAVEQVLACTPQTSAAALLDLGSLVNAILYTQGATGADGELEPLETMDVGLTVSATSARVLKPLIEALTTTGSGRLEVIREAHERGALRDLRLIKHAVAAIDDVYAELGEYVCEHVLPIYGRGIYGELREGFRPKGKQGDARRLRLMHRLDPEATAPLVNEVLEEGSKEVKVAAIGCLRGRADAVDYLLEQSRSRTADVRAEAFRSLATIDEPRVVERLIEALRGEAVALVAPHVAANPNAQLRAAVLEELERLLGWVLKPGDDPDAAAAKTDKARRELRGERATRLHRLLDALVGRSDAAAREFLLRCFALRDELCALDDLGDWIDGGRIVDRVAHALVLDEDRAGREAVAAAGAAVAPDLIRYPLLASCLLQPPARVYDGFRKTYTARPKGKSRAAELERERAQQLGGALHQMLRFGSLPRMASEDEGPSLLTLYRGVELDPRWLDLAIKADDLELALSLRRPGHRKLEAYLASKVQAEIKKKTWSPAHDLDDVLRAMIDIGHPKLVPLFVEVMKRAGQKQRSWWDAYYLLPLIPSLPAAAVGPLEALTPNITEGMLDGYVEQLDELKQKHAGK